MTGSDEYATAVVRALAPVADVLMLAPVAWAERYAGDLPVEVRLCPLPWYRHRDPRNLTLSARSSLSCAASAPMWSIALATASFGCCWPCRGCAGNHWWLPCTTFPTTRATQSQRVPMVTVRRLRRAADAVIVHGDGLARELARTGIRPPAGIHAVPHPVLDRHARLAGPPTDRPPDDRPRLLFFSAG
jgi:hypothetical protein